MPDGVAWPRPTPQPRSSSPRHVRHRRRRRAMGRRGEGPGRRLPGGRCGPRHPLRGWEQRRSHGGQPPRPLQAPPDPVGDLLAPDAQPARQWRGHQPAGAGDRARRARCGRHRLREPADQRSRPPGHAVPRPARPPRGARARRRQARHDLAWDRPRVRRQGRAAGDPDRRPHGTRAVPPARGGRTAADQPDRCRLPRR